MGDSLRQADTEKWALGLLLEQLTKSGVKVALLGRPPVGPARTPDFEIEVDDARVGVEVTQFWPSRVDLAIAELLADGLRLRMAPVTEGEGLGRLYLHLTVGKGPRKRAVNEAAGELAEALLREARGAQTADWATIRPSLTRRPRPSKRH